MGRGSARWLARLTVATLCGGVALTLAGCVGGIGGGDKPKPKPKPAAAVPNGFVRVQAGSVSLAVPAKWRQAQPPQGWSVQRTLTSRAGVTYAQAGVVTDVPQTDDVNAVATAAWAGTLFNAQGLRRGKDQHVTVPGAAQAIRVDYTYTEGRSGKPLSARGMDLSVVYGGKKAFTLRVTGLQDNLPATTVDQIAKSLSVNG